MKPQNLPVVWDRAKQNKIVLIIIAGRDHRVISAPLPVTVYVFNFDSRLTGTGSVFLRTISTFSCRPAIERLATLAPRIPLLSRRSPKELS